MMNASVPFLRGNAIVRCVLFSVGLLGVLHGQTPSPPPRRTVPQMLLVRARSGVELPASPQRRDGLRGGSIESFLAGHGVKSTGRVVRSDAKRNRTDRLAEEKWDRLARWYSLKLDGGANVDDVVSALGSRAEIEAAEPVYEWRLAETGRYNPTGLPNGVTDPRYDEQWGHPDMDVPKAWDFLRSNGVDLGGSHSVVVAVIDSGVDQTHPELAGAMWTNPGEIAGNGVDDDGNGLVDDVHGCSLASDPRSHSGDITDYHGHGTHVAGIVAARAYNGMGGCGVAFSTRIMAIRVAQYSGILTTLDAAEGIAYAAQNGADVINMSFGGYQRSQLMEDALSAALSDCILVAAAGNNGVQKASFPFYPAALPWIIGVMARTPSGGIADFSNKGYEVSAPGVQILSCLPDGKYGAWSGTSMAAPAVSGVAALMRSFYWDKQIYSSRFLMGCVEYSNGKAYNSLTVKPPPGLRVLDTWLLDGVGIDAGNDGDGGADSGETIHVGMQLINRSGRAANITAHLRARREGASQDDPYVTISTDTVALPDTGAFAMVDNGFVYDEDGVVTGVSAPFVVAISPDCPNDHVICFELTTASANGFDPEDTHVYTSTNRFEWVVQRGRNLPSVIDQDMTLTQDEYWIIGSPVLVEQGVTLTVEEGTPIQWGAISTDPYNPGPQSGSLTVRGTLRIQGTAANPVRLFPSYLVSGQTVNITGDAASAAVVDIAYARITNPYVQGLRWVDHVEFEWDRYTSLVKAQQITNSAFRKLRGGGTISAGRFERCLFEAGWTPPTSWYHMANSVVLQDNEAQIPTSLSLPYCFSENLTDESGALLPFHHAEEYDGSTYVILPMELVSRPVADLIADYYGGHITSVRDQAEADFLADYLDRAPGFRAYGSGNYDWYYIGLADERLRRVFEWTDGTDVTFTEWGENGPGDIAWGSPHVTQALAVTNNGKTKYWGWSNEIQQNSSRTGHGGRSSWRSFVLRVPGSWTIEDLQAPFDSGAVLDHVRQNYRFTFQHNAFLNPLWDINLNHWGRIKAPAGANGFSPAYDTHWGTDSQTLIDHCIIDYNDNFTTTRVEYGTPALTGFESSYPFVQELTINGEHAYAGPPTLGAGPAVFEITFNRDMDTAVQPFVTYGPASPYTDFRVKPDGDGWVDARTWRGIQDITPVTGDGYQRVRVSGGVAAGDPWLVSGYDVGRFRFQVRTMGVAAMTLQASGGEGAIQLGWQQNDYDLIAGYHLYRAAAEEGPYTRVNATVIPVGQEEYVDTDVTTAVPQYYKFTVVLTDMSESGFSNIASAAPLDTVGPVLTHTPVVASSPGVGRRLTATATDNVSVQGVTLHYRQQGTRSAFVSLSMTRTDGQEWSGTIPGTVLLPPGAEYYLVATDGTNETYHGSAALPHVITVDDAPALTSVSPDHGPTEGGTLVTLTGYQFQAGATVQFGGAEATEVSVVSSAQITCRTPAHFPATVDVTVTNPDTSGGTRLNGYRYETSDASLAAPSATGDYGTSTGIEFVLDNAAGLLAADLVLQFDPAVLDLTGVSLGSLVPGWAITANEAPAGTVTIAMAGTQAVTGSGSLVQLNCEVIGQPPAQSPLLIVSAMLNDGAIAVHKADGLFTVRTFSDIAGQVTYYQGAAAVPGVNLRLMGGAQTETQSAADGSYLLTDIPTGTYSLQPSKSDQTAEITAYDASLVLQAAAGSISLSPLQVLAGDVNANGQISAMDASYILRNSVGLDSLPFPGTGRIWAFSPADRTYELLVQNQTGQNFAAVLIGDVSGNWALPTRDGRATTGGDGTRASASLTLARVYGAPGSVVATPVTLTGGGQSIKSLDLVVEFDSAKLEAQAPVLLNAPPGALFAYNLTQSGRVSIGVAADAGIAGDLPLLELRFRVFGLSPPGPVPVSILQADLNEGQEAVDTADGAVTIQDTVATPAFSPDDGSALPLGGLDVAISCATAETEIWFTTDGSDPAPAAQGTATLYSGPVHIDAPTQFRARAYRENWLPSSIGDAAYAFTTCAIPLRPGYQFIGSHAMPDDPDLLSVTAALRAEGQLDVMRDSSGKAMQRVNGSWANGIGDWAPAAGYLVRMAEPATLEVSGPTVPPQTPFALQTGTQFLGYLPPYELTARQAFDSLVAGGDLDFVRDSSGNTLQRVFGNWLDGIGAMSQGQGYLVKMNAAAAFTYPSLPAVERSGEGRIGGQPPAAATPRATEAHWPDVGGDPSQAVWTIFLVDGGNSSLEIGDELAVFEGTRLVGAMVVTVPPGADATPECALKAWQTLDAGPGYMIGDAYTLRIWKAGMQVETTATVSFPLIGGHEGTTFPAGSSPYSAFALRLDQTIDFATPPAKETGDAPFALTAAATSGLPVGFTSSDETVVTVDGASVTIMGPGTATITANQAGNGTWNPAPDVPRTLTVSAGTHTVTFRPGPHGALVGGTPDVTVSANGGDPVPVVPAVLADGGWDHLGWDWQAATGGNSPTTIVQDWTVTALYGEMVPTAPAWTVDLTLAGATPTTLAFGMRGDARDGWDPGVDVRCPPPGPGQACLASGDLALHYSTDRHALSETGEFLLVACAPAEEPVTVSWDVTGLPEGKFLTIYQVLLADIAPHRAPVAAALVGNTALNPALAKSLEVPAGETRCYMLRYGDDLAFDLAFQRGWNLVSLPIEPLRPAVSAILEDGAIRGLGREPREGLRGAFGSREAWTWQGQSYGSVAEMHACVGYWVYAIEPTVLLIAGTPADQTALNLLHGWNQCGVALARPVPAAGRIVITPWTWDAQSLRYRAATILWPGYGYWINASESVVIPLEDPE